MIGNCSHRNSPSSRKQTQGAQRSTGAPSGGQTIGHGTGVVVGAVEVSVVVEVEIRLVVVVGTVITEVVVMAEVVVDVVVMAEVVVDVVVVGADVVVPPPPLVVVPDSQSTF